MPEWAGHHHWHSLYADLGDGSAFLQRWHAWRQDPQRPTRWHVTAVLPAPAPEAPANAEGTPWADLARALCEQWRGLLPGVHRLALDGERVQLTLCVGTVTAALAQLDTPLDELHLSAASLADAPDARSWARWCRPGACLLGTGLPSDFCAALPALGFEPLTNRKGVASGWRYTPQWPTGRHRRPPILTPAQPQHAVVVGGGLAGAAVAHALALRGWRVEVLDRAEHPAAGASGLPVGVLAPHVSPDDAPLSRLSRQGIRSTWARAGQLLQTGTDWATCGVLEHQVEGKHALPAPERWPEVAQQAWSRPANLSEQAAAHLPAGAQALWHTTAGWIRPAALVRAQLGHPNIHWRGGCTVAGLERVASEWQLLDTDGHPLARAPHVVLASAFDTGALLHTLGADHLPVHALRGQVSWGHLADLPDTALRRLPPTPVNGHGSWVHGMPGPDGTPIWLVGSTFERGATQGEIKAEDQQANQARLHTLLPALGQAMAGQFEQAQAWAGVRCTLPDRLPAVGPLSAEHWPGLHVCTGLGARGLTLSVLCGEVLAARLHGEPWPVEKKLAQALMAERFLRPSAAAKQRRQSP